MSLSKTKKVEEMPVEPKEKSSKKKIFILIGAIILLIALLILGVFLFMGKDKTKYSTPDDYPVVYLEDTKLVLWNPKNDKKLVISSYYSKDNNKELNLVYANNDSNKFAFINDGKLLLGNLAKEDIESVDSEVLEKNGDYDTLVFSKDDRYLVYVSTDKKIYAVDTNKKAKAYIGSADSDQDIEFIALTDNKMFFAVRNSDDIDAIYYSTLDGAKKEKIANNVYGFMKNNDGSRILYYVSEENNSYSYYDLVVETGKVSKLKSNVTLFSIAEDFKKYTYAKASEEVSILNDDEEGKDPVTEVTTKEVCTYSYYQDGLCSYNDWLVDRKVDITKKTSKKEVNDKIREYAKTYKVNDLYLENNGSSDVIAKNVITHYYSNYDNNTAFYKSIDANAKVNISALKSLEEFQKFISDHVKYYFYNDGNVTEVTISKDFEISYAFVVNSNLYIGDTNYNLYIVEFKDNVGELVKVTDKVLGYYYKYENEDLIYGMYDSSSYTYSMKVLNGKEVTELAQNIDRTIYKNDKLYISHNCSNNACDKAIYTNGELKTLVSDAYIANIFPNDKGYAVKNYSSKNSTYDLYRYENGEVKQIAFDVPVGYTSINVMK